jgi:hypothetical protein
MRVSHVSSFNPDGGGDCYDIDLLRACRACFKINVQAAMHDCL